MLMNVNSNLVVYSQFIGCWGMSETKAFWGLFSLAALGESGLNQLDTHVAHD